MNVTIGNLTVGVIIGYKAASYEVWNAQTYQQNANNNGEWSGLYIAEDEKTAYGYLIDMVTNGTGTAYIHKVGLTVNVSIITCLDDSFKTGNIDMNALKQVLRGQAVNVQNNQLFIPTLGQLNYFFKCYNNEEGAIEIIAPNIMTDRITMSMYKKYEIKNYKIEPCKLWPW